EGGEREEEDEGDDHHVGGADHRVDGSHWNGIPEVRPWRAALHDQHADGANGGRSENDHARKPWFHSPGGSISGSSLPAEPPASHDRHRSTASLTPRRP